MGKDWCKKNDVKNEKLLSFIKEFDDKNFYKYFSNKKNQNIKVDEKIENTKLKDWENALTQLLQSIKKNDKGLTINDSEGKKDEEINFDDEVVDKILDDSVPYYESTIRKPRIGNLLEYERIRNLSEFDEYIKKIKNENNKNIINALVEKQMQI